jgi:HAD superfamily hydrolase (TIGR01490 family)
MSKSELDKKNLVKKKVAFFDIDGTIFRSSLLIEIVEELIRRKVFSKESEAEFLKTKEDWINRHGQYEDYIMAVVQSFVRHIQGVPYKTFMDIAEEMVEKNYKKTYIYTKELIKELKDKNYFVIAISQSPKGILDKFCKHFGFDKVYGRMYELGPEDQFTGKTTDEHLIQNKGNIVRRAVEKENLTLKGSVAVGDTEGDIPMLELVEKPICFNPNKKLYRYAKINKWKVVVERKDVVYEL